MVEGSKFTIPVEIVQMGVGSARARGLSVRARAWTDREAPHAREAPL